MSAHVVPVVDSVPEGIAGLRDAIVAAIRAPDRIDYLGATVSYVFTPDLTAGEVTTFTTTVTEMQRAAVASAPITRAERASVEDELAQIRTFRQQSQSEFIAKTQNQRDREIFDTLNSLITVQRTILRDG